MAAGLLGFHQYHPQGFAQHARDAVGGGERKFLGVSFDPGNFGFGRPGTPGNVGLGEAGCFADLAEEDAQFEFRVAGIEPFGELGVASFAVFNVLFHVASQNPNNRKASPRYDSGVLVRGWQWQERQYNRPMTVELVRDALHSNQPFKVFMADGRFVDIPHPDFAMLSRSGRILHVSLENDRTEAIDVLLVVSVQKQNGVVTS